MTFSFRSTCAAVVLACASLAPGIAGAQLQSKVGGITPVDSLSAQEHEMLSLATEYSKKCGDTLERWIAGKETSEDKLFSSIYYPMPKTDPPKFTTDWDRLSDRDILPIEEAVVGKSPVIVFAVMVDKFGYLPTHNARYSQPLTGNLAIDLVNNRTKRIFNDRTGLAAARSVRRLRRLAAALTRHHHATAAVETAMNRHLLAALGRSGPVELPLTPALRAHPPPARHRHRHHAAASVAPIVCCAARARTSDSR